MPPFLFGAKMAYSYQELVGDGVNRTFTIPFVYVKRSEVFVYIDGQQTTDFEFLTDSTISLDTPPANGLIVRIARVSDLTTRAVDFVAGAVLSEEDLDTALTQVFNGAQEAVDKSNEAIFKTPDGKWDSQNYVIKNVGNPVDDGDAVNLGTLVYQYPKVETVANSISAVNTNYSNINRIQTISDNIAKVQNVDANMPKVVNVSDNMSKVTNIVLNMEKVSNVSQNMTDVQNTSVNISSVQSYANTYKISSVTPSGAVPVGTQWFNTTNNIKYIKTSTGAWSPFDSTVHTEFVGLKVTPEGNLIVTRAQGNVNTADFDEWFFGLSDATFTIDTNGNFKVSY